MKQEEIPSFKSVEARNTLDYMLRTAQQGRLQLNMMADQKASILLGAEVVMLTLLFGRLKIQESGNWVFVLAAFVLVSAVFALMSVMPKYKIDIQGIDKPNWLFFAFSAQVSQEEYRQRMAYIAQDNERIYEAIVDDLYQVGYVLYYKKFRYLNLSYKTLLLGMVATFFMLAYEKNILTSLVNYWA